MFDTIAAIDHKLPRYRHDADVQRAIAAARSHDRRRAIAAVLRAAAQRLDADLAPSAPPRFG